MEVVSRLFTNTRLTELYFFVIETTPTFKYTLSLHDALPISSPSPCSRRSDRGDTGCARASRASCRRRPRPARRAPRRRADRKSTRLNSSHLGISYAVFCLKKKTRKKGRTRTAAKRLTGWTQR